MDMNRAFFLRKEDHAPKWWIIDAEGLVLGRVATQVADILRGKNKPSYTPHTDGGDYVVVINAEKVKLTGNKLKAKEYASYSGWVGGLKIVTAEQMLQKHPTHLVEAAVKGMLPKNKLNRQVLKKLKVYAGGKHPHQAQALEKLEQLV